MFRGSQDLLLWLLARPRLHHGLNRKVIERFVRARAGLAVDVIHDGAHELLSRHIGGRTFTGKSFKKCSHLAKTHPLHKQRGIVVGEEIPTAGHHAGGGVKVCRRSPVSSPRTSRFQLMSCPLPLTTGQVKHCRAYRTYGFLCHGHLPEDLCMFWLSLVDGHCFARTG